MFRFQQRSRVAIILGTRCGQLTYCRITLASEVAQSSFFHLAFSRQILLPLLLEASQRSLVLSSLSVTQLLDSKHL